MILTRDVCKYFGPAEVLNHISFEINKGEIVGFLGQNGAGKTTLMRILTTYLAASSGEVFIAGENVLKNTLRVRKKIGYLPEVPPLYPAMSVRDYLKFTAQLRDIPVKEQSRRIEGVLGQCDLLNVRNKTIAHLSKGFRQRVGIAQAIIHEPEILILDEPTSGLDPLQILQVRNLIKELEFKRTIILSTHILSEIEQIAQRVVIIHQGRILEDDSLINFIQKKKKDTLEEAFLDLVENPR